MACEHPTSLPLQELQRDGVRLCFHDSGVSDTDAPPLLFIHGNSCDSGFFAPQVARFALERRVIAVDLRGHGASDAPEQPYEFDGFADDCAWMLDRLAAPPCIVVGHSMGGAVAVDLALRWPERVRAVAALDSTLIPDHAALQKALPPMIREMESPLYLDAFSSFFDGLFLPPEEAACDGGFRDAIWRRMAKTPQHVMVSLMELLLDYEGAVLESLRQPLLYAGAERWRTDPEDLRKRCADLRIEQIRGAGHFLMLESPQQVNELLERFFRRLW